MISSAKSRYSDVIIPRISPFHNRQIRGDAACIISRNHLYIVTIINGKMPGEADRKSITDLNWGNGKRWSEQYDPILNRDIDDCRASAKQRLIYRRADSPQTDTVAACPIDKKNTADKQTVHHCTFLIKSKIIEASLSAWYNYNTGPQIRFIERGETQCSRLFFTRIYTF